jgi:predicted molibdopterin-dependent oxidoreductase YjgC
MTNTPPRPDPAVPDPLMPDPLMPDPLMPEERAGFRVTLDGAPVTAQPGQTIAGLLIGGGRVAWRSTRSGGRQRGLFCGIGICFDCLITVNGRPNQRACVTEVRAGDVVTSQRGTGFDEYKV